MKTGKLPRIVRRGAGVIFHIKATDEFMFYLRDDKDTIPFPNMVCILGGHIDDKDNIPIDAAMRELGEELEYLDTKQPFKPNGIIPFRTFISKEGIEQHIFGCELDKVPKLTLKEGQKLVFLKRDELATTDFAFGQSQVVQDYARTV